MATELISLGILFLCAVVGGVIAARFKQPAVFGLLLVGAIIGPNLLNMVQDAGMISIMADFGAILLLFVIGLEFDLSKMMKVGARSILIGLLKFAIVLFFGYQATLLLGFSIKVALFVGVILSFSSTVVIVKVLEQKEMFTRKEVPLLIAVLIIEDIIAVLVLTFFSSIKGSQSGFLPMIEHIFFSIAVLVLAYSIMMKVLKYAVNILVKNSDDSILTFLSLAIGALFSYFAVFLGLTPSAGAFLAGSLIASLPNAKEYGKAIHPYALIFTSIFFISMGTLVDFRSVESNLALILVLMAVVFVSRFVAVGFLTFLLANFKDEQPFFSSIAMVSVGEFSLIIAKESGKFGLGIDLVTITASIIFISAIFMSIGLSYSESIHSGLKSRIPVKTKIRMEKISSYMRGFFDQMEIENFFTNKLRKESRAVLTLAIIMLFAFFMLRRIALAAASNYNFIFLYAFYAASAVVMMYLGSLIYRKLKSIHGTLSAILTHVDSSRNIKKCSRIINSLLFSLALFFSAMLFPFVIFAFNLNIWANLVPFGLIIAALYYIKGLRALIESNSSYVPSYSASAAFAKI